MSPDEKELLDRTYRLAKENNQMLRSMRRSAFIGGLIKILIYAAVIGIPIWFYFAYIHETLNSALRAIEQVQGSMDSAGAQLRVPISDLSGILDGLKAYIPGGSEAVEQQ
jgi:hypothetical protein